MSLADELAATFAARAEQIQADRARAQAEAAKKHDTTRQAADALAAIFTDHDSNKETDQ